MKLVKEKRSSKQILITYFICLEKTEMQWITRRAEMGFNLMGNKLLQKITIKIKKYEKGKHRMAMKGRGS